MPARLFPRLVRRVVAVSAVVALMGSVSVLSTSPERDRVLAADVLGAGGEFHPLEPQRVLDTRAGVNVDAGERPLLPGEGQAFEVSLSGRGGLPEMDLAPVDDGDDTGEDGDGTGEDGTGEDGTGEDGTGEDGTGEDGTGEDGTGEDGTGEDGGAEAGASGDHPVLAVALSVTVVEPTQRGYLRAFGSDEEEGTSSIVNFSAGETVPNMTILAPGADGSITVRLVSEGTEGTAHVLIDVFGWFSKGTYSENGSRLIPVGPGRIFDSRNPTFGGDPVGPGEFVEVPVAGADSLDPQIADIVPDSDGVTGALVNVTGVNQGSGSEPTFVSVVPDQPADGAPPTTSNLNLRSDHVKANLVMVPVGPDGSIWLYNSAGEAHLVVDVVAYLEPRPVDTREGRVIPLRQPLRVLDTRQDEFGALRLAAGQGEDWTFRCFVSDVRIGEDWVGSQSAFLGNLTATGLIPSPEYPDWAPPVSSYLTVYPSADDSSEPPEASNLNIAEGESVPNAALFRYGSREVEGEPDPYSVRVYNFEGEVHYVVDAAAVVLDDDDEAERADCSAG